MMERVRPGEDETLAAFSPSNPLIKLDLPTFDRPRKANSGAVAEGNCSGDKAESRNFVVRCTGLLGARLVSSHRRLDRSQRLGSLFPQLRKRSL